jgi:DNA-binding MarR family transcriptional regulator
MKNLFIEDSFVYLLGRTTFGLKARFVRQFRKNGFSVTPEQMGVMTLLWQRPGMTQREIGDKAIKDKANVTRILDVMERNNIVERRPDSGDRRVFRVYLTENGKKLQDMLVPIAKEVIDSARKGLTDDDIEKMRNILSIILKNLDDFPPD